MSTKKTRFSSSNKRFRLMLTLELAVMLPAAVLIYLSLAHVKSISRDKKVEASIHRDFQRMLADSETHINDKFYETAEGVRDLFPSPDGDADEKARKLDLIMSERPWLTHVFLFEADKGTVLRSQPQLMSDKYIRAEHEEMAQFFGGWFGMEGKILCAGMREKSHPISCYTDQVK